MTNLNDFYVQDIDYDFFCGSCLEGKIRRHIAFLAEKEVRYIKENLENN